MAKQFLTADEVKVSITAGLKRPFSSWKEEVATYFDRLAPEWDTRMEIDEAKINFILDAAAVTANAVVLDVACGTGVLFPYYLRRNVARVIGVDISAEMARIAATKVNDPRLEVICGDIQMVPVQWRCDCVVIYNAFPHFEDPPQLIAGLTRWLKADGRLTVAHGMGLEALRRHHVKSAKRVSCEMLPANEMAEVLAPWFEVDTKISDQEKYIVSGKLGQWVFRL